MASNRRRAAELIDLTKEEVITITDDSPSPSPPSRPQPRRGYIEVVVDFSDSDNSDHEPPRKKQFTLKPRQPDLLRCTRTDIITTNPTSQPPPPPPPPPPKAPDNPLKCPICITPFHEIKQTLQSKCVVTKCGHLFCEPCIKKALQEQGRKCPKCRKLVPKNTKLIEVYDVC